MPIATHTDAVEVWNADGGGPLVLTCEHASRLVPPPLRTTAQDRAWLDTHWGWDIGAADVTRRLAERLDAPAVLGTVSRLLLDLNRDPDDPTLIRRHVEGVGLSFNDTVDVDARLARWHGPFHAAVDAACARRKARGSPVLLFSVHSFTPDYMGSVRTLEMGVLFNDHEDLAVGLADDLSARGWRTGLNEPWSGRAGLIYSAERHGRTHGLPYLELEVRQDLIADPDAAEAVADRLVDPLRAVVARL
jgi:predicted N-formylglutamate amidohydrolase